MRLSDLGESKILANLVSYFGQTRDDHDVVRALTPDYPGDVALSAGTRLRGMIPGDPLFLFVGQIAEAPTLDNGALRFALHFPDSWENAPQVTVKLPTGTDNRQSEINHWRVEQEGWVWLLASSSHLTDALLACRNSLLPTDVHPVAGDDCAAQGSLLAGEKPMAIEGIVLMGIQEGASPVLLAGDERDFYNRWLYADLGPYGLPLLMPEDTLRDAVASQGGGPGIVRTDWDATTKTLLPSDILQRDTDGIYRRIWP